MGWELPMLLSGALAIGIILGWQRPVRARVRRQPGRRPVSRSGDYRP